MKTYWVPKQNMLRSDSLLAPSVDRSKCVEMAIAEDVQAVLEALERLNKAVTVDVLRIFARWVDEYKEFREPQLIELRAALLQADKALGQAQA